MKRFLNHLNAAANGFLIAVFTVTFFVTGGRLFIKECLPNGRIYISDDGNTYSTFTCEGFNENEIASWALGFNNGNQLLSYRCSPPGQPCDTGNNLGVNVSRPMASSSVLTIERNYWKQIGYPNVICSSFQNSSNLDTCYTSGIPPPRLTTLQTHPPSTPGSSSTPPSSTRANESDSLSTPHSSTRANESVQTTTDGNEEKDNGLPIAAIAGGVAAFLVIIIIIIVVVVVVRRRKRQKKAHADNNVLEEHVNPMYGSGDEPETASPSNSKPSGIALRIPTDTTNNDNNGATVEDADNAFDAGYSSMVFGEQQTVSPSSTPSPDGQSTQNTASQAGLPTNTTTPVVVTDADLYTSVDGIDQEQTSGPLQDHAGGHPTEGGPKSSSTAAPKGDVYSVVQKSVPRAQSASATTTVSPSNPGDSADGAYAFVDVSRSSAPAFSTSKAPSGDPVSDNADNTYAVVNKSSSQDKGTGATITPNTSNSSQQAPSGDVYAQVDKSSKRNGSTPEHDGEGQSYVYAQVDKPSKGNNPTPVQQTQAHDQKPGIKPKPALKPKPSFNV